MYGTGLPKEPDDPADSPELLNILLNRRARIVKLAAAKLEFLSHLVSQITINKCLIYCADLEQLRAVQAILAERGIAHLPYTHELDPAARQTTLEQLNKSDIRAVVAVKCLDEGVDVPQVHQAILLASSTSEREFVQRRGRILRKAPGKQVRAPDRRLDRSAQALLRASARPALERTRARPHPGPRGRQPL